MPTVALGQGWGEAVEGAADGGDEHPRLAGAGGVLVIRGQPPDAPRAGDVLLHGPAEMLHQLAGGSLCCRRLSPPKERAPASPPLLPARAQALPVPTHP